MISEAYIYDTSSFLDTPNRKGREELGVGNGDWGEGVAKGNGQEDQAGGTGRGCR